MQVSQTKLEERCFFIGFVANDTPLTIDSLPTWQNGLWGGAIIQKCIGLLPVMKVVIYRVQLERIELRMSPNN